MTGMITNLPYPRALDGRRGDGTRQSSPIMNSNEGGGGGVMRHKLSLSSSSSSSLSAEEDEEEKPWDERGNKKNKKNKKSKKNNAMTDISISGSINAATSAAYDSLLRNFRGPVSENELFPDDESLADGDLPRLRIRNNNHNQHHDHENNNEVNNSNSNNNNNNNSLGTTKKPQFGASAHVVDGGRVVNGQLVNGHRTTLKPLSPPSSKGLTVTSSSVTNTANITNTNTNTNANTETATTATTTTIMDSPMTTRAKQRDFWNQLDPSSKETQHQPPPKKHPQHNNEQSNDEANAGNSLCQNNDSNGGAGAGAADCEGIREYNNNNNTAIQQMKKNLLRRRSPSSQKVMTTTKSRQQIEELHISPTYSESSAGEEEEERERLENNRFKEGEEQYVEEFEVSFYDYTLNKLGDVCSDDYCGGVLKTDNEHNSNSHNNYNEKRNNNKENPAAEKKNEPPTITKRKLSLTNGGRGTENVEEHTAIEVEYVENEHDHKHENNNDQEESTHRMEGKEEGEGARSETTPGAQSENENNRNNNDNDNQQIDDDDDHHRTEYIEEMEEISTAASDTSKTWTSGKKNAYLAAMARKAKQDFTKSHNKRKEKTRNKDTSKQTTQYGNINNNNNNNNNNNGDGDIDNTHNDAREDSAVDVYSGFTPAEKRHFLKMVSRGLSPSESAERIQQEKKQKNKAGNKKAKGNRFIFWKKGTHGGAAGAGADGGGDPESQQSEQQPKNGNDAGEHTPPPTIEEEKKETDTSPGRETKQKGTNTTGPEVQPPKGQQDSGRSGSQLGQSGSNRKAGNDTSLTHVSEDYNLENTWVPTEQENDTINEQTTERAPRFITPTVYDQQMNNQRNDHQEGNDLSTEEKANMGEMQENKKARDGGFIRSGINYYDAVRLDHDESEEENVEEELNTSSLSLKSNKGSRTTKLASLLPTIKAKGFSKLESNTNLKAKQVLDKGRKDGDKDEIDQILGERNSCEISDEFKIIDKSKEEDGGGRRGEKEKGQEENENLSLQDNEKILRYNISPVKVFKDNMESCYVINPLERSSVTGKSSNGTSSDNSKGRTFPSMQVSTDATKISKVLSPDHAIRKTTLSPSESSHKKELEYHDGPFDESSTRTERKSRQLEKSTEKPSLATVGMMQKNPEELRVVTPNTNNTDGRNYALSSTLSSQPQARQQADQQIAAKLDMLIDYADKTEVVTPLASQEGFRNADDAEAENDLSHEEEIEKFEEDAIEDEIESYIESTDQYSNAGPQQNTSYRTTAQQQNHMETRSVMSSGYSTVYTQSSTVSTSSKKRRKGAAKQRLARSKQAQGATQTKKGWKDTMEAAAESTNREWKPQTGWIGYKENMITVNNPQFDAENPMQKIRINLHDSVLRSKDKGGGGDVNKSNDTAKQGLSTEDLDVLPLQSDWEKETGKGIISADEANEVINSLNAQIHKPYDAQRNIEYHSNSATSYVQATATENSSQTLLSTNESVISRTSTLTSKTGRRRSSPVKARTFAKSPKPMGWAETMRVASTNLAGEGRVWDKQVGWVTADGTPIAALNQIGLQQKTETNNATHLDPNASDAIYQSLLQEGTVRDNLNITAGGSIEVVRNDPEEEFHADETMPFNNGERNQSQRKEKNNTFDNDTVDLGENVAFPSSEFDGNTKPRKNTVHAAKAGLFHRAMLHTSATKESEEEEDGMPLLSPPASDFEVPKVDVVKVKVDKEEMNWFPVSRSPRNTETHLFTPISREGDESETLNMRASTDRVTEYGNNLATPVGVHLTTFKSSEKAVQANDTEDTESEDEPLGNDRGDEGLVWEGVIFEADSFTHQEIVSSTKALGVATILTETFMNEPVIGDASRASRSSSKFVPKLRKNKRDTSPIRAGRAGSDGSNGGNMPTTHVDAINTVGDGIEHDHGNSEEIQRRPLHMSMLKTPTREGTMISKTTKERQPNMQEQSPSSVKLLAQKWEVRASPTKKSLPSNEMTEKVGEGKVNRSLFYGESTIEEGSDLIGTALLSSASADFTHEDDFRAAESEQQREGEVNQHSLSPRLRSAAATAEWKSFLGKKVREEKQAAARQKESLLTNIENKETQKQHNLYDVSDTQQDLKLADKSTDSIFDFGENTLGGTQGTSFMKKGVAAVNHEFINKNSTEKLDTPMEDYPNLVGGSSPKNSEKKNRFEFHETMSDEGFQDNRGFLDKIVGSCAPVVATAKGASGAFPLAAHMAFLRSNTQSGQASNSATSKFPPFLCGRPDVILEEGEEEIKGKGGNSSILQDRPEKRTNAESFVETPGNASKQPCGALHSSFTSSSKKNSARSTSREKQRDDATTNNSNEMKFTSTSSVISEDFGAKTSYLDSIAMKTAVSKPRRGKRERSYAGSTVSQSHAAASSTISNHSSSAGDRWKAFLDRKSSSGVSPAKSRASSSTGVSKAAEKYAAEKVDEMMAKMASRSKSTPRNFRSSSSSHDEKSRVIDSMLAQDTFLNVSGSSSSSLPLPLRKSLQHNDISIRAAEDLAAARVNAMMAALSSKTLDEGEI